jgi:NADP-dependent 3-hydroxy acid dehydrogenase YdfG
MQLHDEIEQLKKEIQTEETKVAQALQNDDNDSVSKSLAIIDSNLKYLSIVVNGAPLDKIDDKNIREFLRVHYENMCKLSLPA